MSRASSSKRKPVEGGPVDVFSRMEPDLVKKLDELAEADGRSRSGMVERITRLYVDEHYPQLQAKHGATRK